jgi:hypothetical protein
VAAYHVWQAKSTGRLSATIPRHGGSIISVGGKILARQVKSENDRSTAWTTPVRDGGAAAGVAAAIFSLFSERWLSAAGGRYIQRLAWRGREIRV